MAADVSVVHTGKDGALIEGGRAAVDAIFERLRPAAKVVLHFHGGLNDAKTGLEIAGRLDPVYRAAGAEPVFFVWESGLLEILRNNLTEIAGEDFFKIVLKYVLKFAVGKVNEAAGAGGRGLGLQTPDDMQLYKELAKRDVGQEPFRQVAPPAELEPLSEEQRRTFEDTLAEDPDFQATAQAIVDSILPEARVAASRGIEVRVRGAGRTLMSRELLEEMQRDANEAQAAGQRGLISTAAFLKHAGAVLVRVIKRFRAKHDHGLYPTVVEEILREFYLANAGLRVWRAMKGETSDTFSRDQPLRGGYYFARKLNELARAGHRPQVTLVGHSTGAVFINNLLAHLQEMRTAQPPGYPQDYVLENVVFLAPACTFQDFGRYVVEPYFGDGAGGGLYKNLRIYAMSDAAECNDHLIPYVYTRSLLYFVSGVLEPDEAGKSSPDVPLVGMQRYFTSAGVYDDDPVKAVRRFVSGDSKRTVWSPTAAGAGTGLVSHSLKHGDFDNDSDTLASVSHLIAKGY